MNLLCYAYFPTQFSEFGHNVLKAVVEVVKYEVSEGMGWASTGLEVRSWLKQMSWPKPIDRSQKDTNVEGPCSLPPSFLPHAVNIFTSTPRKRGLTIRGPVEPFHYHL